MFLFYIVFQVLKVYTFCKISYKKELPVLLFFVALLCASAFTSADIIFCNFVELHSELSEEKKKKVTNFSFLTDWTNPLYPFNGQNPLTVAMFFVGAP